MWIKVKNDNGNGIITSPFSIAMQWSALGLYLGFKLLPAEPSNSRWNHEENAHCFACRGDYRSCSAAEFGAGALGLGLGRLRGRPRHRRHCRRSVRPPILSVLRVRVLPAGLPPNWRCRPRILKDLKAQDEHVSRKRVIRLMQQQGLVARVRRRYKCTTMSDHDQPVASNLNVESVGQTIPNLVMVPVGTGGAVSLFRARRSNSSARPMSWDRAGLFQDKPLGSRRQMAACSRKYVAFIAHIHGARPWYSAGPYRAGLRAATVLPFAAGRALCGRELNDLAMNRTLGARRSRGSRRRCRVIVYRPAVEMRRRLSPMFQGLPALAISLLSITCTHRSSRNGTSQWSRASVRVVLPAPPWPTMATLRILLGGNAFTAPPWGRRGRPPGRP